MTIEIASRRHSQGEGSTSYWTEPSNLRVWMRTLDGRRLLFHARHPEEWTHTRCGTMTVYRYADGTHDMRGTWAPYARAVAMGAEPCRRCWP